MHRSIPALPFSHSGLGQRLRQAGYTLYELLVTSVIAGTLGTGVVGYIGLLQDERMTASVNGLMGNLMLARSEAIKRDALVTVCKSRNGMSCTDDSAWEEGWLIFADNNGNHTLDSGESVIHAREALAGGMTLRYGETGGYDYIRYNGTGEAWPGATFTFCDRRGTDKAKAVIVYWSGRPRISTKTSEGKPLRCS